MQLLKDETLNTNILKLLLNTYTLHLQFHGMKRIMMEIQSEETMATAEFSLHCVVITKSCCNYVYASAVMVFLPTLWSKLQVMDVFLPERYHVF